MSDRTQTKLPVQYMTRIAILAALSAVLFLVLEIPIFGNIYKLDFSNLPVLLAAFSMGPVPALITLAIKDVIHLIIKGMGTSVGIGDLADFIMTAAFVLPAALIYGRNKSRRSALIGMVCGTIAMAAVALLVNGLMLFPFYMSAYHMDLAAIAGALGASADAGLMTLLLTTTLPFNLLKGVVLCLLTYLIYKPLSPVLHVKKGR